MHLTTKAHHLVRNGDGPETVAIASASPGSSETDMYSEKDEERSLASLPEWVALGQKLHWWSESRKRHFAVRVAKIDERQCCVIAALEDNPQVWNKVPFSMLGKEGCPLRPYSDECAEGEEMPATKTEEPCAGRTLHVIEEVGSQNVKDVLRRLDSIRQLAGDAQVLRRKENLAHNTRSLRIAQLHSLLLEEAEFNPQAVRQRNVLAMLEGINLQNPDIMFFSSEEASKNLFTGPSVKLRDAIARPYRVADKLLVDTEVLSRMMTQLDSHKIQDILNRCTEYLTFMQTTYQLKPLEERDHYHVKNASGIACFGKSLLVADCLSNCIWRVSATRFTAQGNHEVELFAGGLREKGFRDGPLRSARFNTPMGIVVSAKTSDAFIADTENNAIRRIDLHRGFVSTIRLQLTASPSGLVPFEQPKGICIINGDRRLFAEMEAAQKAQIKEYKELKENEVEPQEEDSGPSSSALTSSVASTADEEETTSGSSSMETSTSNDSAIGPADSIGAKDTKHTGKGGVAARNRSAWRDKTVTRKRTATGQNQDSARDDMCMSLEQTLSFARLKKYTVLHSPTLQQEHTSIDIEVDQPPKRFAPDRYATIGGSRVPSRVSSRVPSRVPSRRHSMMTESAVEDIRDEPEIPAEIRLAITADHCVWYVDPYTGYAEILAGQPMQYGFCDASLGLAARFSSPKGIINIRSVLMVADYWNNVIRCVNLYTTQVDTIVDFAPQGPVSVNLSESGVLYCLDAENIYYANILRIMSSQRDVGDGTVSTPAMAEDRYQTLFSQPQTTQPSRRASAESSKAQTEVYDEWNVYQNQKGHGKGWGTEPFWRNNWTDAGSADFKKRLQDHLQQAKEEQEQTQKEKQGKAKKGKAKKKKKKKKKESKSTGSRPTDDEYKATREAGRSMSILITQHTPDRSRRPSALWPSENEEHRDVAKLEDLIEDDEQESGHATPSAKNTEKKPGLPHIEEVGSSDLAADQAPEQSSEKADLKVGDSLDDPWAQNLKNQLQKLQASQASNTASLLGTANIRKSPAGKSASKRSAHKSSSKSPSASPRSGARSPSPNGARSGRSAARSPRGPRSVGARSPSPRLREEDLDDNDHVQRTQQELAQMELDIPAGRKISMTLKDLGVFEPLRKGSFSMTSKGWQPFADSEVTNQVMYQTNRNFRMLADTASEASMDPDAGTIMVTGGKAYYRYNRDRGWSFDSRRNSLHQSSRRNSAAWGSRRTSHDDIQPVVNPSMHPGEDEAGCLVHFVDLTRESRRGTGLSAETAAELSNKLANVASRHSENAEDSDSSRADSRADSRPASRRNSFNVAAGSRCNSMLSLNPSRRNSFYGAAGDSRRNSFYMVAGNSRRSSVMSENTSRRTSAESRRNSLMVALSRRHSKLSGAGDSRRNSLAISVSGDSRRNSLAIADSRRGSLAIGDSRRGSLAIGDSRRGSLAIADSRRNSLAVQRSRMNSFSSNLVSLANGDLYPLEELERRYSLMDTRLTTGVNVMPTLLDTDEREEGDNDSSSSSSCARSGCQPDKKKDDSAPVSRMSSKKGDSASVSRMSSKLRQDSKTAPLLSDDLVDAASREAGETSLPLDGCCKSPTGERGRALAENGEIVEGASRESFNAGEFHKKRFGVGAVGSPDKDDMTTTAPSEPARTSVSGTPSPTRDRYGSETPHSNTWERSESETPYVPKGGEQLLKKSPSEVSIMSLNQVPFTRDIDVVKLGKSISSLSLQAAPSADNSAKLSPTTVFDATAIDRANSVDADQDCRRRYSAATAAVSLAGTYKVAAQTVSKTWRTLPLPSTLAIFERFGKSGTRRRYPNTPLSLAWYEADNESFLLVGLLCRPQMIKIIPPKHHEPEKGGRFNVLPIDGQQVLLADESSHQIRLLNHQYCITKHLAGCGKRGFLDGPLETCRMHSPCSMTLDPRSHYIYVADRGNHVIRKIDLMSGLMSTVVGNGTRGNGDGADPKRQALDSPFEVSFVEPHCLVISCADNSVRSFNLKTRVLQTILVGS